MKNMIKTAALIVGLTLTTATPSVARDAEYCKNFSIILVSVAELRDMGMSVEFSYGVLTKSGLPHDVAMGYLEFVYRDGVNLSPKETKVFAYDVCMGGVKA